MSVDKYGVDQDPACYPGTDVLINLLNLRDVDDLAEAERYLTQTAAAQLEFVEPPYDVGTLKRIHRHLFSQVYSWAGEIRTVKISKGESQFCVPDRIEPEAAKEFRKMAQAGWFEGYPRDLLVAAIAESYGTLNVAHPFREGNGRTQRILFEWVIVNAGFEITWGWLISRSGSTRTSGLFRVMTATSNTYSTDASGHRSKKATTTNRDLCSGKTKGADHGALFNCAQHISDHSLVAYL